MGGVEHNLMTIKDVAEYMQLAEQTIQRWVMKREIPYHKVKKVIRFRFSEVEKWINEGGGKCPDGAEDDRQSDLFTETGETTAESKAVDGGEVQA
jgi:excisionase family DNA binding protein